MTKNGSFSILTAFKTSEDFLGPKNYGKDFFKGKKLIILHTVEQNYIVNVSIHVVNVVLKGAAYYYVAVGPVCSPRPAGICHTEQRPERVRHRYQNNAY